MMDLSCDERSVSNVCKKAEDHYQCDLFPDDLCICHISAGCLEQPSGESTDPF